MRDEANTIQLLNQRPNNSYRVVGRAVSVLIVWATMVAVPILALNTYARWMQEAPDLPDILEHTHEVSGIVFFTSEGASLNRHRGAQTWTPIHAIPPRVISAFLAAEDDGFYDHDGVDTKSVMRAAYANIKAQKVKQGASTITQQLAKMYVGRAKSYERKLREAILARRIEMHFSKDEILEAYLNKIYLGAGANGITAAAQIYFGKALAELTVAEVALIAGLTSAPSAFNPFHNFEGARKRQVFVLGRMLALGFIEESTHDEAMAETLAFSSPTGADGSAPYLVSAAKRELRQLGPELAKVVVEVELTANLGLQAKAVGALRSAAQKMGKNRRDRVRLAHLPDAEARQAFLDDQDRFHDRDGDGLIDIKEGAEYGALVLEVGPSNIEVAVGSRVFVVSESSTGWLHWGRYDPALPENQEKKKKRKRAPVRYPLDDLVSVHDFVRVRILDADTANPRAEVLPKPNIQGALVSIDADSGSLRALAGGTGFDLSQYNRATRGCRQPGSAFKPILYSEALARGKTPASAVHDLPERYEDTRGALIWEPRNADRRFKGSLTLASALAASRNLPAVKLGYELGFHTIASRARRLGLNTPQKATPSLVLGASCVKPIELGQVYAAFARRGVTVKPRLVRSVSTSDGRLMLDNANPHDAGAPADALLARLARFTMDQPERVMREKIAYLTSYMLRQVVARGTAYKAKVLGVPIAGKTGTTNNFDVWFAGYSDDVVTMVWLGDDRNQRELGEGETGGTSALPAWVSFMEMAVRGRGKRDPIDDPPDGVEFHRIDPETGWLAHDQGHGQWVPFSEGTAPTRVAPSPRERRGQESTVLDRDF